MQRQNISYFQAININSSSVNNITNGLSRIRCTKLKGKTFTSLPQMSQFASQKHLICSLVQFEPGAAFKSLFHHKEVFYHIVCIFNPELCTIPYILLSQISPQCAFQDWKRSRTVMTLISKSRTSRLMYSIRSHKCTHIKQTNQLKTSPTTDYFWQKWQIFFFLFS